MVGLAVHQKGASVVSTLITIAVLGYGAYVGFQYVPYYLESQSVGSILYSLRDTHRTDPLTSVNAVRESVIKRLQINELNDLDDSFKVSQKGAGITVTFSYDRELDLLYKKKLIHYEKSVNLKK